jgi:[ribosomal protein S5]-alanine N-acetyltransferase
MKIIMETDRLFLREFMVTDAESLYALNLDTAVLKFTGDKPFSSVESAKDFLAGYDAYEKDGFGRWAVIEKFSGEFTGWCGLKRNEENLVDLGFRFLRQFWNNGYATESAGACLDFGFNRGGLEEIIGRSARQNKASIRVMEKINMKFWKEGACDGIPDAVYYRIRRKNYFN